MAAPSTMAPDLAENHVTAFSSTFNLRDMSDPMLYQTRADDPTVGQVQDDVGDPRVTLIDQLRWRGPQWLPASSLERISSAVLSAWITHGHQVEIHLLSGQQFYHQPGRLSQF